jgi:hypothetical protein
LFLHRFPEDGDGGKPSFRQDWVSLYACAKDRYFFIRTGKPFVTINAAKRCAARAWSEKQPAKRRSFPRKMDILMPYARNRNDLTVL